MKAVIYHAFSHKEAKEHDVQVQSFKGGLGAGDLTAKMAQNLQRKTGLAVLSRGLLLIFTELGSQRAEAFVRAFLKRSIPHLSQQDCESHLQRKAVVLEYFTRQKPKQQKKKSKGLSAKQRRDMRLFDINPEQQRYSLFLPLHELWKQYIRDLCHGLKPDTQPQMIQAKLLKADLHGAIISVTKSKCPSYVGVTGILLQETKHVFKIITKEDHLKVIPKLNCVFAIEIDDFISYIYGSKFQLRSSERSARKFKVKGTIDL